jgi:hypothetical protein
MQTVAEAEEKLKGPHVGVVVIKMIEYIFQRFFLIKLQTSHSPYS